MVGEWAHEGDYFFQQSVHIHVIHQHLKSSKIRIKRAASESFSIFLLKCNKIIIQFNVYAVRFCDCVFPKTE